MNMNGRGKRKRDQETHSDTNKTNTNASEGGRNTKRPKQKAPKQTGVEERKGIG